MSPNPFSRKQTRKDSPLSNRSGTSASQVKKMTNQILEKTMDNLSGQAFLTSVLRNNLNFHTEKPSKSNTVKFFDIGERQITSEHSVAS